MVQPTSDLVYDLLLHLPAVRSAYQYIDTSHVHAVSFIAHIGFEVLRILDTLIGMAIVQSSAVRIAKLSGNNIHPHQQD